MLDVRTHRSRHQNPGNTAHLGHCEPTLALMESIAETIPDAVFNAQKLAYEAALQAAHDRGYISIDQQVTLLAHSPYSRVPPGWTQVAF